jgi:hypothetical protein
MNAAQFGGLRERLPVANGLRYPQRDPMAQNARWNLEATTLVLLSLPARRVK